MSREVPTRLLTVEQKRPPTSALMVPLPIMAIARIESPTTSKKGYGLIQQDVWENITWTGSILTRAAADPKVLDVIGETGLSGLNDLEVGAVLMLHKVNWDAATKAEKVKAKMLVRIPASTV